nr:MAG TPA: hypothetical protein [Caudoviricetes sp.]
MVRIRLRAMPSLYVQYWVMTSAFVFVIGAKSSAFKTFTNADFGIRKRSSCSRLKFTVFDKFLLLFLMFLTGF